MPFLLRRLLRMPNRTLAPLALALTLLAPVASDARTPTATVVVQDPYLELHSGPGRGYPVVQVVDRGREVRLERQRTDWIKVSVERGPQGWVHRAQLERTLTPQGEAVRLPGPSPESRVEHRWEVGGATGDFAGASVISVNAAYSLTRSLQVRADVSQLLGNYSNAWLATAGLAHSFMPQWRVSPFVAIGGGALWLSPDATLVQALDRNEEVAYAALGLRGFLTDRFLLQTEYRGYVLFTNRDENEELDAWTLGFTYFF
jgi:hypothetical protein